MSDLLSAAKLALEALENYTGVVSSVSDPNSWTLQVKDEGQPARNAIEALRAAIEQAEKQEPKCGAIIEVFGKDWRLEYMSLPVGKHKLYTQQYEYTAPPQREWQNAALRIGEELSSVGPDGYYAMSSSEWLDWALAQNPKGKTSLQQREWQGLTDEEVQNIEISASSKESAIYLAEGQLKGKNAL